MSWNEFKVGLAPIGSAVFESKDRSMVTADGYPVSVLTVRPPDPLTVNCKNVRAIELWLTSRGFHVVVQKKHSARFRSNDIEALVVYEEDLLQEIILNFQVELDVRERLGIWRQFVGEFCESHRLRLIDREIGLVGSEAFEGMVKRSFAWQCFLEREKRNG